MVVPALEYSVVPNEQRGSFDVLDPAGHRVSFYGPDLDGDLAQTLAEAEAGEKTFELRFMADFLGVTVQHLVEAQVACRAAVDGMVDRGAL
jgi:hypothetical protein